MTSTELFVLAGAGLFAGILAGFLGIGGGTVLVPLLVALGRSPVQAVATSTLSIVITATSGTLQNWRMGYITIEKVLGIGLPAILTAQLGALLAETISDALLLVLFGCLLLLNIYLVEVRKRITARKKLEEEAIAEGSVVNSIVNSGGAIAPDTPDARNFLQTPTAARLLTGAAAGLLAGLFGVGGGVIMVPLQILLLGETIKAAIQTSLGVIVITAVSACAGHALRGNVLWTEGFILGFGGLIGVQVSTRFLPKMPDRIVSIAFRSLLATLAVYIFWQAYRAIAP